MEWSSRTFWLFNLMVRFNTGKGAPSWLNLKLRLISRVGNGMASDRVQRVRNRFLKEIRADRKWMNAGQHKYPPMWNQYSWLPSSGYKMYTFKISDSEPFPWQRRGWQFFYFLGFHWTTPENIIITQTERPILIIMISKRRENLKSISAYGGVLFRGCHWCCCPL